MIFSNWPSCLLSSADMTAQVLLSYNGTPECFSILCCYLSKDGTIIFTAFALTYFLLSFPLCLYVLNLVFQRWWQQRSSSTTAVMSSADVFTLHIAAVTQIGVFGCLVVSCGLHGSNYFVIIGGLTCWLFSWYGETIFHVLTCLERYLAVVHPITYLELRSERGIFIRNISFVCVWLLCLVRTFIVTSERINIILDVIGQIFSLSIAIFCNFNIFYILFRPTPGKQGRDGIDRTKLRALIIIMAIVGTLFLRFTSNLVIYSYYFFYSTEKHNCIIVCLGIWSNIPSSVVIPLLFLHRAWK